MGKYKIKFKDLEKLSDKELIEKLNKFKMELIELRSKVLNRNPIKETKKIREIRKNIARILFLLSKRKHG